MIFECIFKTFLGKYIPEVGYPLVVITTGKYDDKTSFSEYFIILGRGTNVETRRLKYNFDPTNESHALLTIDMILEGEIRNAQSWIECNALGELTTNEKSAILPYTLQEVDKRELIFRAIRKELDSEIAFINTRTRCKDLKDYLKIVLDLSSIYIETITPKPLTG